MATLASLVPALAVLCAAPAFPQTGQPRLSLPDSEIEDTYAAYSALISQEVGAAESSKILIMEYTRGGHDDANCLKAPEGQDATQYTDQINRYLERNKASYRLVAKFDIGRPYELVGSVPNIGVGRPALHVSLSAIGFNTARDRAVVYMEYGGMGGAHFLTKVAGKWAVDFQRQPRRCGWIA